MEEKKTGGELLLGCDSDPELPEEIVFELLIRLPVKKISECRCVSKSWCSIIEHPSFTQSYRRHNPLCLVSSITVRQRNKKIRHFLYSSTFGNSQHEQSVISLFNKKKGRGFLGSGGVTQVVNGLCCYYCRTRLFLTYVFTSESVRLPLPDIAPGRSATYFFGFDPVNGVYKVLSFTLLLIPQHWARISVQCDILTLGSDNPSWRRLPDTRLPISFNTDGVFVNGAIYWIGSAAEDFSNYYVYCFNLTSEEFRTFSIDVVEEEVRPPASLAQFRGRLSLLACFREKMIIYTLGEDDESLEWSRHEAVLPSEFWHDTSDTAVSVGNLPTGEMLLLNLNINNSVTPIYSYDDENNKLERFVAAKLPEALQLKNVKAVFNFISYMEQNVENLDVLIGGGKYT